MKLAQLIDTVLVNILRKSFVLFGRLGPKSSPFFIYEPANLILLSLGLFPILKMFIEMMKNSYIIY